MLDKILYIILTTISVFGIQLSCTQNEPPQTLIEIMGMDGIGKQIEIKAVEALKSRIIGKVLSKDSTGYHHAREIWNLSRHNLLPALVIHCVSSSDVKTVVNFAREYQLLLSVKGGGHNSAGFAINNNGIVIDLSEMKGIQVDKISQTARVGAGVTWGELDRATQRHGLATTGAIISQVGVGGFTLGGGLGWLHRSLGAASDNLLAVEMVTAAGEVIRVSPNSHPDLFWALRGAGSNFGVITSFEFQLHPVGPEILAGLVFYPFEKIKEVVQFYRNYIKNAPDELGTWLLFRKAPPIGVLPTELHGKPVVIIAITYNGAVRDGQILTRPLRKIVIPIVDQVQPRDYVDWQHSLDGAWGDGFHNLWQGHYFMELTDQMIDSLASYVPQGSPFSDIKIQHLEGKFGRYPDSLSAFGNRQARFGMVIQTRWKEDSHTAQQEKWAHDVHQALRASSTGKVYVNFIDDEGQERVKDGYSEADYHRLRVIKRKYDPMNLFRRNQNIPPAK